MGSKRDEARFKLQHIQAELVAMMNGLESGETESEIAALWIAQLAQGMESALELLA